VKETNVARLRLKSMVWPVLVVLLVLLQLIFPYRGWLILLIGISGAWIIGYLYARSLVEGLRIVREMRFGWARVGDILEERFQIINNGWAPGNWIELTDYSTIPGRQANIVTGVGSHSHNSWVYQLACTRRGLYTIGPTRLLTSDLFGIYSVDILNNASANLLVTPPVLPLPSIQVTGGGRAGEGRPARKALEQSISVNGIRDYAFGESLRWIHWPTVARRDQLYVKTFDHTPISDWWIVLDLEARLQTGEGQNSTEETSVTLAASLADRGMKSGLAVGLITNAHEPAWLSPQTGQAQFMQILQTLALVSPGSQSVCEILQNALPSLHHQSSLVLITPEVSGEWLQAILLLMQRGVVPTILLLDPSSFQVALRTPMLGVALRTPMSGVALRTPMLGVVPPTPSLGGEGSVENLPPLLANLGIQCYVITPDILDASLINREQVNSWQWRTLATGRALPVHRPGDLTWKGLS
jgi:uncharacterized protein (DUF58 family)